MTQIIVAKTRGGLALAADSKGYAFDEQGKMQEMSINPLIPLGQKAALIAGGDADAVQAGQNLSQFIKQEGLSLIPEIYAAALPFLNTEYEKIMRRKCNCLPVDPIQHIYFILAGISDSPESRFQLHLIWARKKLPQLDGDEITSAFSVPRQMGFEYTLGQLVADGATLEFILSTIEQEMHRLNKLDSSLASPPFRFATISEDGFKQLQD
ncbi:MAG: hypothetical protein K9K79_10345 [Desulfohalobiaceae bacterium]|nr:hypothetical protein [Desulfohalobiaceae bacterium]